MNEVYKRLWLKDETLTYHDFEGVQNHDKCYAALLCASKNNTDEAQQILNSIKHGMSGHNCPVVLEVNALVSFSSRDFESAKSFALAALEEQHESLFSYWVLASISMLQRRYDDAILNYKKILEISADDKIMLDVARAYVLQKDFKSAQRYIEIAAPSTRKTLYKLFIPFSRYLIIRLLWLLIIFLLLAASPYLFVILYLAGSIFLVYVAVRWGYKKGDRMLFNIVLFIQSINSVFFLITLCALLDKYIIS